MARDLRSAGASGQTWLEDASLAYLPRNVAPEVLSISALPIGVGLQQMAQITDRSECGIGGSRSIIVWGRGPGSAATTFSTRRALVSMAGRGSKWRHAGIRRLLPRANDGTFRLLKDKLRENFYTIDGATLADGRYIIKIMASDGPDNPAGQALTGERLSEPVDIDNTPPVLRAVGCCARQRRGSAQFLKWTI